MENTRTLLSLTLDRNTAESGWHKRPKSYDHAYISQIIDPSDAQPKRGLNAVPSPFARLHAVDTAFGVVNQRYKGAINHDGSTIHHRLVSECLDMIEFLFKRGGEHTPSLTVDEWIPQLELKTLVTSERRGHQLLGEVLELYITQDGSSAGFDAQSSFAIISVAGQAIAMTSPMTLLAPAPKAAEVARRVGLMNPSSHRALFSEIIPLHRRDSEFQAYLRGLFLSDRTLQSGCPRMWSYIERSFELLRDLEPQRAVFVKDISLTTAGLEPCSINGKQLEVLGATFRQQSFGNVVGTLAFSPLALKSPRRPEGVKFPPIVWQSGRDSEGNTDVNGLNPTAASPIQERVLPDKGLPYPYLVSDDIFEPRLFRLPYAANSAAFVVPTGRTSAGTDEEPGILLPLKSDLFEYFDPEDIVSMVSIQKTPGDGVEVSISLPTNEGVVRLTKSYYDQPRMAKLGALVAAPMNCAVFPRLIVENSAHYNDRFWVMLVDNDLETAQGNDANSFDLDFYATSSGRPIKLTSDKTSDLYVSKTPRSKKEGEAGSTYYEVCGGPFDFMQVRAYEGDPARAGSGILIPKWTKRRLGNKGAKVAVDFGTTNTHVAWRVEGELPETLNIGEDDLQMALLNAPRSHATTSFARFDVFPSQLLGTEVLLRREFMPSIIGAPSPFKFPLRTATCEVPGIQPSQYSTLRNINLAFGYGIIQPRKTDVVKTDLKWSLRESDASRDRSEALIEQLLMHVRSKLLLNGVDPEQSTLTWFRPLSFDPETKAHFERIWAHLASDVLKIPAEQVTALTESEAPYYYHEKAAKTITSRPVVCIDIGGGSTDVVFFEAGKPKLGTSFSFAGNALWGAGFNVAEAKLNGVVEKYLPIVEQRINALGDDAEKRRIRNVFDGLKGPATPSEEWCNFFFSISNQIGFSEQLSRDSAVKALILLHYTAIIYHCAQLMKAAGLRAPEYLCFSGRGSQSLNILDVEISKKRTSMLTQEILQYVYSESLMHPTAIILAADSKEATCLGGLWASHAGSREDSLPVYVATGDGSSSIDHITYGQIDGDLKDGINRNIDTYITMLRRIDAQMNFRRTFGIEIDLEVAYAALISKNSEYIQFGLQRRRGRPDDPIDETLFFYPFTQKLYEISHLLCQ
jgi:hypothetical protein